MNSFIYLSLSLCISLVLADGGYKSPSCPTVTKTTTSKGCPAATPAFCPQPQCILLSKLDVPCGCPNAVATKTDYIPCTTGCHGSCGTAYETNNLCTPTPTLTTITLSSTATSPISCVTITKSDGPGCPNTCLTPDCIVQKTVTNPCGCTGIAETTVCKTKCDGACSTQWKTLYLPCPTSVPSPTPTGL